MTGLFQLALEAPELRALAGAPVARKEANALGRPLDRPSQLLHRVGVRQRCIVERDVAGVVRLEGPAIALKNALRNALFASFMGRL